MLINYAFNTVIAPSQRDHSWNHMSHHAWYAIQKIECPGHSNYVRPGVAERWSLSIPRLLNTLHFLNLNINYITKRGVELLFISPKFDAVFTWEDVFDRECIAHIRIHFTAHACIHRLHMIFSCLFVFFIQYFLVLK